MDGPWIVFIIQFNSRIQKMIYTEHGVKKVDKTSRKLKFKDVIAARNFLFQLKRLHHLWNRSDGRAERVVPLEIVDKAQFFLAK